MKQQGHSNVKENRLKQLLASMRGIKYLVMENESSEGRFPLSSKGDQVKKRRRMIE